MTTALVDPAVAAVAYAHRDWDPGRTWYVIGTSFGVRKLLSAHYSRDGQVGAEGQALDLAGQGVTDVEIVDGKTGRRWKR